MIVPLAEVPFKGASAFVSCLRIFLILYSLILKIFSLFGLNLKNFLYNIVDE